MARTLSDTLRGYIEGTGGTLKLVVGFPDCAPVQISGIDEVADMSVS